MADEQTIEQQQIQEQPVPQEMPQPDPPTKKMYDLLVKGQLYSKSYEDFQKQYSTPENIDKLYNGLSGAQLYSKSKEEFYGQYFPSAKGTSQALNTVEKEHSIEDIRKNKDVFENPIPSTTQTIDPMSGGSITTPGTSPEEIKAAKDQFDAQTKGLSDKWGIEPDKVQKVLADFPNENDPVRLQAKAKLQKDNPESYEKLVAADENMHLLAKNGGNGIAHDYNELQGTPEQPINTLSELTRNISLQRDMINSNLSGNERQRALDNLEKNRSSAFNATSPEIINEYTSSDEIKSQLTPMQFAGLKSVQAFDPQKYKLYTNLIAKREDSENDTVEQKIGLERVKKELLDIGRRNTSNYLNEHQYDLDNAYKNAKTEEEKNRIAQDFLHNKSLADQIEQDAKKDDGRFPYLKDLEFERQAKELSGSPDNGVISYALKKFGRSIGSAINSIQNAEVNAFGTDQDIAQHNLQRLGEAEKEKNEFYLPEEYKSEGSPFVYKFDKDLQDQATKIKNDKNLSDEQKSGALIDLVKENPDQVHTITNIDKYGKSASIFSKATLYKNAGMIGDLASFAAQQAGSGGIGLPKFISSAVPMFIATQNDFYKQALEEGRANPMEYANTHAAIMMAAGAINPDLSIVKRSLGATTELGKVIADVSESTWDDAIKGNKPLITKIQNSLLGAGKEATKMGLTYGAGTSIASDLANKGLFGSNLSGDEIVNRAIKATKDITTSSIGLLGLHAISNFKSVSPEEKARVWELGDNPKLAIERLDDAVNEGEITTQVADQRKAVVKKIAKLIDSVPTENAKGRPLTDQQRSNYLYNLLIKDKTDDIKSDLPDAQKEKLEAIKRSVDIDNNAILDPKSEKENLMQRKRELTELLAPDAEGKSTLTPLEKKTHQTELDDITQKLDDINSPKQQADGKDKTKDEAQANEGLLRKSEGAENQPLSVVGATPSILESRHADTPRDERGITSGQDHSGLSEDGVADANKLAESVKGKGVTKVISSDLERGKETAKIVADKLGAKVEHDPNLRAWDLGEFDGTNDKDWKELQKYFVEHPDEKEYNDKKLNESFNEYKGRVIKARESLDKEDPGTLLINHSNNMMLWDAYEKNGRQWNEKTSQDYLNAEKPKPATLTNQKPRVSVSTPNIVNVKLKENAIQERRPEEVLQRESGNDGEPGGERGRMEQGQQGNEPPGESGQQSKEENQNKGKEEIASDELPFGKGPIGISHELQEIRSAADLNVAPPERGEGITLKESIDRGKELLNKGADIGKIVAEFQKDKKISSDIMSTVRAAYTELAAKTNKAYDEFGSDSPQAKAAFAEERSFYNTAVKPMQTEWSKIGVAQQGAIDIDTGTVMGLRRAYNEVSGKDFTLQQEEKAKELSEQVKKLTDKGKELQGKIDKLMSEKKEEKSPEDSIKESAKKLAKKIRDNAKLGKPGMFSAATPASLVWDGAVEIVAKTVEAGGSLAQAIADGIEHIRNSDWYKGLSDADKNKAEQQFTEWHKDSEKDSLDLAAKFVNKKDNKFTHEEAKEVWDHVKSNYLDKGEELPDAIKGTSTDLGLTSEQVIHAMGTPKGARETTLEMFKTQYERRKAINSAKRFVANADKSGLRKAINKLPSIFFNLKTWGHGTVGNITHAGPNIFRPSTWKAYWPNVAKSFKLAYGTTGNYEKEITILKNSPNFDEWIEVGLAADPTKAYDEYQIMGRPPKKTKTGKAVQWLNETGTRGFSGLNFMRYDMAEMLYNRASATAKLDPNLRSEIAELVNHATGHSEVKVPRAIKVIAFAPGLEISRWQRMITDPAKAAKTFANWKSSSSSEKAAAKIVAFGGGEKIAVYGTLLAANAGLLYSLGSKQKINISDPSKSDWLRFKFANRTLDVSGNIASPLRLLYTLLGAAKAANFGDKKEVKKKPGDTQANALTQQARYKLSPLAGTATDLATGTDPMGNVLPWSNIKPSAGRHKLTWKELMSKEALPIPVAAGLEGYWHSMEKSGMPESQIESIFNGILLFGVEGFTGAKLQPDYSLEKKKK